MSPPKVLGHSLGHLRPRELWTSLARSVNKYRLGFFPPLRCHLLGICWNLMTGRTLAVALPPFPHAALGSLEYSVCGKCLASLG